MQSMEPLNITEPNGISEWFERFSLWASINAQVTDNNLTAYYLTMIGKEGYQLVKDLVYPLKPSDCKAADMHKLLQQNSIH